MNILVIVDMQNDFITGCLGTKEAQEVLPKVIDFVKNFKGPIFPTMDEHWEGDDTQELQKFGNHCIVATVGRKYPQELEVLLEQKDCVFYCKDSFMPYEGYDNNCLQRDIYDLTRHQNEPANIYVCGLCTDICVLNTALYLRCYLPYENIIVLKDLCVGTTPENHQKALDIMKINLIDNIESKEVING